MIQLKAAYRLLFSRPCGQLGGLRPVYLLFYQRHNYLGRIEGFPLITKVILLVMKVFPLVTTVFTLVTKVTKVLPLVTKIKLKLY